VAGDRTDWVRCYLDLLEVEHAEPGLSALSRVTRAHVLGVPFENITSVLRREAHGDGPVPRPDPEATLERWRQRGGGGVCFEVAAMVDRLLVGLGYRTFPVLAQVTFPGSHQANLVDLDSGRYLVDAGNGAPFLEPIALDGTVEVHRAGLAWRFRPDTTPDVWIQDREIDGKWVPFCHYVLRPADPELREAAFQRHHTRGQSWVVDNLVLTRSAEHEVWSLRDNELRHFTPESKTVEPVSVPADYTRLAATRFGVPALPIDRARAALEERRG
jgi:N-hydroxyarylamine O-acetyltransferase